MKKPLIMAAICIFCFIFTGCDPGHFRYKYEKLSENVVSIEVVIYDYPKAKDVADHWGQAKHLDLDFEKMENIGTIEQEKHEKFFELISDELILNHVFHYNSPNGVCIKMNYENGDFDILSPQYVGKFNSEGEFLDFLGNCDMSEIKAEFGEIIDDLLEAYSNTLLETAMQSDASSSQPVGRPE